MKSLIEFLAEVIYSIAYAVEVALGVTPDQEEKP